MGKVRPDELWMMESTVAHCRQSRLRSLDRASQANYKPNKLAKRNVLRTLVLVIPMTDVSKCLSLLHGPPDLLQIPLYRCHRSIFFALRMSLVVMTICPLCVSFKFSGQSLDTAML